MTDLVLFNGTPIYKPEGLFLKQIKDFTEWLGVLYLDFDNEDKHYVKVVKNEIKEISCLILLNMI